MPTYKTKAHVADNGTLTSAGLPFKSGERVEFGMEPIEENQERRVRRPLRGKPYRYDRPIDGAALAEWGIQE